MLFLLIVNKMLNKLKLRHCGLILLATFCYGKPFEKVYNYKTNQNSLEFLKPNIYAVYSDSSRTRTSNLGCLNRCITLANGYSTVCAGITLRRDETSTVCTMLYPSVGGVSDLPTMKGADIIRRGGKAYWYHPQIDYIERYMGFNNEITGYTINGINIVGKLAFSFGVYAMSNGYVGLGLTLNGNDQWVEFGSHQDSCFGNVSHCNHGFSFALWVKFGFKPDDPSHCQYVFASGDVTRADSFEVCRSAGKLHVAVTDQNRKCFSSSYPVQQYVWFHVALTWNARICSTVLIDGAPLPQPVATNVSLPDQDPGIQVTVGKRPGSTMAVYVAEATLDELYFWETWMRNVEIWKIYTASGLM